MTLRTLNYGNYGIFLIMGNAGFCEIYLGVLQRCSCNVVPLAKTVNLSLNTKPKTRKALMPLTLYEVHFLVQNQTVQLLGLLWGSLLLEV